MKSNNRDDVLAFILASLVLLTMFFCRVFILKPLLWGCRKVWARIKKRAAPLQVVGGLPTPACFAGAKNLAPMRAFRFGQKMRRRFFQKR